MKKGKGRQWGKEGKGKKEKKRKVKEKRIGREGNREERK